MSLQRYLGLGRGPRLADEIDVTVDGMSSSRARTMTNRKEIPGPDRREACRLLAKLALRDALL